MGSVRLWPCLAVGAGPRLGDDDTEFCWRTLRLLAGEEVEISMAALGLEGRKGDRVTAWS